MPLNLRGPRATVKRLTMVDRCIVYPSLDVQQADLTWDANAGDYLPPENPPAALYDGVCSVSPRKLQPSLEGVGGAPQTVLDYALSVPYDIELFPDESLAVVTVIHKGGDPGLLNKMFMLNNPNIGTYVVARTYQASRFIQPPS